MFRRENTEAEMAEEMRFHLDMRMEGNIEDGLSSEEASYAAQRKFGNVGAIQEQARDVRSWVWVEQLFQDTRFGIRQLARTWGLSAVAIITFALGIGAATGTFTVVNALLLRSLPVREPGGLSIVERSSPLAPDRLAREEFTFPTYLQFCKDAAIWSSLAAFRSTYGIMVAHSLGSNEGESVQVCSVSENFFSVLGVPAALGRTLTAADEDSHSVGSAVILSDAFWRGRFGADPNILDKTILLNNAIFTIVGVAPANFSGVEIGASPDLWTPLANTARAAQDEMNVAVKIIGRLRSGVTRTEARSELNVMYRARLVELRGKVAERAEALSGIIEVRDGSKGYDRRFVQFRSLLGIVNVVVGCVLLVACANVAGLLLARWSAKERELAVRSALGANRGRLIRQLLTESLLLAMCGGVLGGLVAEWITHVLAANLLPGIVMDLHTDSRVLIFMACLVIGSGILVGLLPAIGLSRGAFTDVMNRQTGIAGSNSRLSLNMILIVTQIALSVCLLNGAGLFIRTLRNFETLDLGFNRRDVLGFRLQNTQFTTNRDLNLANELTEILSALPGVQGATWSFPAPLAGGSRSSFTVEGYLPGADEEMVLSVSYVGPRFFETLGISLTRGRGFGRRDVFGPDGKSGAAVAVISESLAKKYFGDGNPIGRFVTLTYPGATAPSLEIVGVAGDTTFQSVREKSLKLYTPLKLGGPAAAYQIRTSGDARALAPTLREAIHHLDPKAFIFDLRTMDEAAGAQYAQERSVARIAGVFSGVALTLAASGLYGVLAYNVTRRTREIGIRVALGARYSGVIAFVVRQGLWLALIGCALGIGGAMGLIRFVQNRLFGVAANDPVNLIVTVSLVLVMTLLACWFPARSAAKVDPIVALRAE